MDEIIKISELYFQYERDDAEPVRVLEGIDLSIARGEFVAVLGHNGSGKSTLAKHLNGILTPTEGSVTVDSIDTSDEDRIFDIRQRVGMVFQNPDNQIVATIVEEDVAFALENLGVEPVEIRTRVDEALNDVGMYEHRMDAPHQLSGGQKQRVAIAGIIAMRPDCIVLDEPTAMLDPKGRAQVMKTVQKLNKQFGITIVFITHYMNEAALADRIVVMDEGKIILEGTPREVFVHVDKLHDVGLDVPQVTEVAHNLRKHGIDIRKDVLTDEEFVLEIERLLEV